MDETSLRVYSVLFVAITVVLVYTGRYFQARRSRRLQGGEPHSIPRLAGWVAGAIDSNRPLHLSFGSAGVGADGTPVALAGAEFFHHIVAATGSGDHAPLISASSTTAIPLAQDTLRRAWPGSPGLNRAHWYPQGERSLAYAAAVTSTARTDQPFAHIFAGSFGAELALMLDGARQLGQGTLAVSDQLEGQAIAYAMADEVLIGEQLYGAAAQISADTAAWTDARARDVWRGLLIMGMALLLLLNATGQLGIANGYLVLLAAAALMLIGAILFRRR